jgi:hypothetical protein
MKHTRGSARCPGEVQRRFGSEAGEEIEVAIGEVHAQILGDRRPEETQEEYQLRSSNSLRTAEELVLADHYLLVAQPEIEDPDPTGDPNYRQTTPTAEAGTQ